MSTTPKLIGLAAALGAAAGVLAIPVPAHADCQWAPISPMITINSAGGIPVFMDVADGHFTRGTFTSNASNVYQGAASGGVVPGSNKLEFESTFSALSVNYAGPGSNDPSSYHSSFTGAINPDGSASGTVLDDKGANKPWSAPAGSFTCT
jgi:hypothetical protein